MVSLLNFAKKTNLRWSIPSNMLLRLKRIAFALSTPKMNMSQHSMPNWGAKWLSAFKKWLLKHICLDDFWVFPGAKMMIFLNIQNPTHPPQQKNPKTDWQPLQNLIIQRSSLKLTVETYKEAFPKGKANLPIPQFSGATSISISCREVIDLNWTSLNKKWASQEPSRRPACCLKRTEPRNVWKDLLLEHVEVLHVAIAHVAL